MNTIQQSSLRRSISGDKDEATTQAEASIFDIEQTHFDKFAECLPVVAHEIDKHHDIAAKISQGTFSSDKIIRLLSAVVKVGRSYNMFQHAKSFEKLSGQIGQLRRLLRYDRLLMIVRQYISFLKKGNVSRVGKMMIIFKAILVIGDINDILAFLVQLKLIKKDNLLPHLRKNVVNIYFFECLGWLIYHLYEHTRMKDEEARYKNKLVIIKYILDTLTSHNDFTCRLFTLNPKLVSVVGLISSTINLYLVWK